MKMRRKAILIAMVLMSGAMLTFRGGEGRGSTDVKCAMNFLESMNLAPGAKDTLCDTVKNALESPNLRLLGAFSRLKSASTFTHHKSNFSLFSF